MKQRTTWRGLKQGTKFKVIRNSNSHNYPLNKILTMSMAGPNSTAANNIAIEVPGGNSLNISDCEILTGLTLADLRKEIKEYEDKIKEIKGQVDFCVTNNLDEYDEETHQLYEGIKIVEATSTTIEKAKALKKLLSQ